LLDEFFQSTTSQVRSQGENSSAVLHIFCTPDNCVVHRKISFKHAEKDISPSQNLYIASLKP